ncbi:uncharacterized protein si:dkey-22i16.9 [Xiphias gladius]|uniref:uncharacterized protein si:dkey-22i16.9 n=1 Tax=Xiphias gladius TaxID=8245 RepID=UPI001A99775D|nr:uncharacterized protein si:dkey-22i16.9 [Xiphias gladius]
MAWLRGLSLLGLLFVLIRGKRVNLGDPAELCASECFPCAHGCELIRRLQDERPLPVAKCVDDAWMPEEKYRERVEAASGSRLLLTHTYYNDKGMYEILCGTDMVSNFLLDVVAPTAVVTCVGETVGLPCHAITVGESVKSVKWEKTGALVFEQDLSSGDIRYGTGLRGRVSASSDWLRRGDFSLALERVQPGDRGDYSCYVQYEDANRRGGNPAVVRVVVNEKNPDQTTCIPLPVSPSQEDPGGKGAGPGTLVAVTACVTFVLCAPVAAWFGWWLKSRRSDV